MPKVRALTPAQAKNTLVNRFNPKADRLRQLSTKFGLRPYRMFLVHTKWDGAERGEGFEHLTSRAELLPTPQIINMDNVSFSFFHAGTLPVGSIRVDQISGTFTEDTLRGKLGHQDEVDPTTDFFYEVVEDGRGDPNPLPSRYRLLSMPFRRAGKLDWTILLERVSQERDREGRLPHSPPGPVPSLLDTGAA